jgi:hypothetical protein
LENNILCRFGCPIKIITDNATTFKSKKMEIFCSDYNITLGHSTTYYPQSNGLVESSNKILTIIIEKLLQDNKKAWHKKLIHALWADRITTRRSIATSPFQIVYVTEAIFTTSLGLPLMRLLQEKDVEPDATQRMTNELINVQQTREKAFNKSQLHQDMIKNAFDRHTKEDDFKVGDLVLKWDARNEDRGKHGKFDHMWPGSFKIVAYHANNAYLLQEHNGDIVGGRPVFGRVFKHYLAYIIFHHFHFIVYNHFCFSVETIETKLAEIEARSEGPKFC